MELLIGMSLPGLVILLSVLGVVELVREKRRGGRHRTAMASTGFDILQEALYPSKRYEIEEREAQAMMAEEDDDGAPPRSRIDLSRGTAVIRIPRPGQQPDGPMEGPRG